MISLMIDRSSIPLGDLVIGDDPAASMWLNPSIEEPALQYRYGYAPDSAWIAGKTLLSATLDASSLPAVVYFRAADSAALQTLKNTLITALAQWTYEVTLTVDGESTTYVGQPTRPVFQLDEGLVAAHMARAAIVIPVNPGA